MSPSKKKSPVEVQLDLFENPDDTMKASSAKFSPDRLHRYALWRVWDNSLPVAMFIGLNPSTADEIKNDNTVTKCINYARTWGYGGMIMSNIFAYRATNPEDMKAVPDPVGPDNDKWLLKLAKEAKLIVAAWGNRGEHMDRGKAVRELFKNKSMHCLAMNNTGHPKHPLYCKNSLSPLPID